MTDKQGVSCSCVRVSIVTRSESVNKHRLFSCELLEILAATASQQPEEKGDRAKEEDVWSERVGGASLAWSTEPGYLHCN
jgi:hypothetical protein